MTIVNSNLPANLFIHTSTYPLNTPEERQPDLRLEQIVRATVVKGGLDKIILELNHQRYLAQTEKELQVGQQLKLQVLQTHPRLEFRVLNDPRGDRLRQLLPLLTRPYNWAQLVSQMQQQPNQAALPQSTSQIYNQLQQLLNPAKGMETGLREQILRIAVQLQQLTAPAKNLQSAKYLPQQKFSIQPMMQNNQPPVSSELSRTITQLIKNLQDQLTLLPKQMEQPLSKNWHSETMKLLAPFRQDQGLAQISTAQKQPLTTVLQQIYQHQKVSPQLSGEIECLLTQIKEPVSQEFFQQKTTVIKPEAVSVKTDAAPAQLATDIKTLLTRIQQGQKQAPSPELLGQLEGLLNRLQRLPRTSETAPPLLPGFESIISQLTQLITWQPSPPQGGQLGFLSQLFGFYLETELLHGKQKAMLASLKLTLLSLRKELGQEVEEPLRRLELFQFCKARLAEDQIQFLPLPFNELEEGYLLAERQQGQGENNSDSEPPLQMSLSLRLSALGNIRIDMLYEKQGLHLRLACENQEKMCYLQNCIGELKESLKATELHGVSFSTDAQLPARQLQERLLPDSSNLLDARI